MDTQTATLTLAAIVAGAFFIWLMGVQYRRIATMNNPTPDDPTLEEFHLPEGTSKGDWLLGQLEVQGDPERLVENTSALLVRQGASSFGPIKILEKSKNQLQFEIVGPAVMSQHHHTKWFQHAVLRFTSRGGNSTRIDYAVELAPLRFLIGIATVIQILGLAILLAGAWFIYTFVVSSPQEAIRWQTLQMLQIIHLLWPPFLFIILYRRGREEIKARLEAFLTNLPYYERER